MSDLKATSAVPTDYDRLKADPVGGPLLEKEEAALADEEALAAWVASLPERVEQVLVSEAVKKWTDEAARGVIRTALRPALTPPSKEPATPRQVDDRADYHHGQG